MSAVDMFADDLKSRVWIAPGTVVNGIHQFGTPVLYALNCRVMNSTAGLMAFGPSYVDYRRAVAPNEAVENVKEFDRVWLDRDPADPTDVLATDANFYVYGPPVIGAGGIAQVMFRRLSADG